jgi:hypothetical protein
MKPLQSKFKLDIKNIESVLARIEMGELLGRLGTLPPENLPGSTAAMKRVIARTVEVTAEYEISNSSSGYAKLATMLRTDPSTGQNVGNYEALTVLSFNYDTVLEYHLEQAGVPWTYGFSGTSTNQLLVLKLHGSINWAQCTKCKNVYSVSLTSPLLIKRPIPDSRLLIEFSGGLQTFSCCGEVISPAILAPTWDKSVERDRLKGIWKLAADRLSQVEQLVLCGYSLPDSDSFFDSLISVGTHGEHEIEGLHIFDREPEAVATRIRSRIKGDSTPEPSTHKLVFEASETTAQLRGILYPS